VRGRSTTTGGDDANATPGEQDVLARLARLDAPMPAIDPALGSIPVPVIVEADPSAPAPRPVPSVDVDAFARVPLHEPPVVPPSTLPGTDPVADPFADPITETVPVTVPLASVVVDDAVAPVSPDTDDSAGAPLRVRPRIQLFRPRPRVRRVTRVVRHIDTWSVFKVALVFNAVLYLVCLTAGVLLWNVAYTTGTVENIENFFEQFGWETFEFRGGEIYHNAWIGGLFVAVGLTGFAVLLATMFNLITDLVGGVRVSVLEEEVMARSDPRVVRRQQVGRPPRRDRRGDPGGDDTDPDDTARPHRPEPEPEPEPDWTKFG
jgi:hypothetical protein